MEIPAVGGTRTGRGAPETPNLRKDEDATPDVSGGCGVGLTPVLATASVGGGSGSRVRPCDCISIITVETFGTRMTKPQLADIDCVARDETTAAAVGRGGGGAGAGAGSGATGGGGGGGLPDLLHRSPTLRYLHTGYRNFVVNDAAAAVHHLDVYNCRLPRLKLYRKYKTVSCYDAAAQPVAHGLRVPASSVAGMSGGAARMFDAYKLMEVVHEYLGLFSVLADFNFTMSTPHLQGGLFNALVVDKAWTDSPTRPVKIPYYRLLEGDSYTDSFVNQVKRLVVGGGRMKYLRFTSTINTVMYTNRKALAHYYGNLRAGVGAGGGGGGSARPTVGAASVTTDTTVRGGTGGERDGQEPKTVPIPPPKKRRLHTPQPTATTASVGGHASTATVTAESDVPHRELYYLDIAHTHCRRHPDASAGGGAGAAVGLARDKTETERTDEAGPQSTPLQPPAPPPPPPSPSSTSTAYDRVSKTQLERPSSGPAVDGPSRVKNPTLILFKHNVDDTDSDTLLCSIVIEINLADRIAL